MTRSIFKTRDVSLSVSEHGEGLPFVFQHGLCGDADQMIHVFPDSSGFRCLTVECRGHGQSEIGSHEAFSIPSFADDVTGFISGLDRPVIGGISMGAAISLRIAVHSPHMIRALILARPAWVTDDAPKSAYPNLYVGQLLSQYDPKDALHRFEMSHVAKHLAEEGPDNLIAARGFFTREPVAATSALLTAITSSGPGVTEDEIREIAVPTLVIGNRRDPVHPISYARTLAEWIPSASFVEITSKSDSVEAYRQEFKSALNEFLRDFD
ncbi:alpha/beta fold hydrolase [Agrobacterium tumefaciens]|uniref:alpha/beta fold hydrolase n=1 Tax=Agrobacterium tumefaciens TaxID=358 RepID=UPI001573F197|nr:alpha/beta hydrolase [Agrobacterium tumefaciens]NTD87708.1 alpha/beta hydrolase [Agrobacterium tumefaciens]NTD91583.1 alpha/beta hydrolase [Agrobacterium tumefaciens]NTD95568.1 alpha/beta hydrolase [Agrobacterium tumefaciens]NTE11678.1 alpha/beta hydrolase [Agrobacterium tumefaciens]NTE25123.1 alpha/beta hydrolase [Agrobacterium tumefaciens]